MPPETKYAQSGDVSIAYQVVGDGERDLLYIPTWISQLEQLWEEESVASFFRRLAEIGRLILFDRRGSGLSDRADIGAATLEQQMDDVLAVLDAAGSQHAAVFAQMEGATMAALFAATYPERTDGLVLYAPFAHMVRSDDVPWALSLEERHQMTAGMAEGWGTGARMEALAPSRAGDARMRAWFARLERLSASPGSVRAQMEVLTKTDVRHVWGTIRVPTLVMHRKDDEFVDVRHAHYIAERVPGARFVELPGRDTLPSEDEPDALLGEIEEFLTGTRHGREADRVLATVMFTDIVESTSRAAKLGDRRWRDLLESHDTVVRRELGRFRGREIKTIGDGFLVTFDGPARAVRCATAIRDAVAPLELDVRAGLHTGEVEVIGDDVGGMAVNIGARISAAAGAGEVLVSSTVKDLVVGSGLEFADRGARELKGVPGEWRLFSVDG